MLIKLSVQTMLAMAAAGIAYASVCVLGYGPPLPKPSWGALIGTSAWSFTQAPWIVLSAGLFIILAALSFNLVAMGLRKSLTTAPGPHSLPTAT